MEPSNHTAQEGTRMKSVSTWTVLVFLCAGCATANYSPTGLCTGSGAVRLLTAEPPAGTYKVCGSVAISAGGLASYETAIEAAKREAAKFGANALIVVRRPDAECSFEKACVREGSAIAVQLGSR